MSFRPAPHAVPRGALATAEIRAGVTVAHAVAGGALPSLPWLAAVAALVMAVSVPVVSSRVPLATAALGVGAAQQSRRWPMRTATR